MSNLPALYDWFHAFYRTYYSPDPEIMRMVKLKEGHSIRVAQGARELALSLELPAETKLVAEIAGLLHDIARAEQAHRKTFNDALSFDHGDRGADLLSEHPALRNLPAEAVASILFAVKYHNKMIVPPSAAASRQLAAIVRDADKLDIFRTLPPIEADHNYSEPLIDLLRQGKPLPYAGVKTSADKRLVRLSWFSDINYPWTMRHLLAEGYAQQLLDTLPHNERFALIRQRFEALFSPYR